MEKYTHESVRETELIPAWFLPISRSSALIPAHWHEYLEILLITGGTLRAVVQAREYRLLPGDILVINSGDIHMTECRETSYLLLQISVRRLQEFFPGGVLPHFRAVLSAENVQAEPMRTLLRELEQLYSEKREGWPLLFTAKLYEFIYLLQSTRREPEETQTSAPTRDIRRMTQAVNWIGEHYSEPLTLEAAAEQAGLSREHFCRVFRRYTGQTFLEYLNTYRTQRVYEDLTETSEPLGELLLRHGIASYRVFSRTFRTLYGDTPQHVRQAAGKRSMKGRA